MEQVNAAAPSVVDANGFINVDGACRRCSYNVRGLHHAGRCPECGTPAGLSIYGDLLRFSDPQWLETLARGISYMLWGILVALLVNIAGGLIAGRDQLIASLFKLAGSALGLYGAWLLTEPDPSGLNEGSYVTARKLVRLSLLAGLLGQFLQILAHSQHWFPLLRNLLLVAGALVSIMHVIGEFAKLAYLEMLAKRIPNDAMTKRANFLRWAYGISWAVMVAAGVFTAVVVLTTSAGAGGGAVTVGGCIMVPTGLAMLVFGIMVLILLYRMGRALREQAGIARQIWAAKAAVSTPG